jgi:hypothetical protein
MSGHWSFCGAVHSGWRHTDSDRRADSTELEDAIDWLIVGDGSDPGRYVVSTTSHPEEAYDDVVREVEDFGGERNAGYEVVRL